MNEWDKMYQELVDFKQSYQHTNVALYDENEKYQFLAKWVSEQRCLFRKYKAGEENGATMSLDKATLLEALDFDGISDNLQPNNLQPNDLSRNDTTTTIADAYTIRAVLHSQERKRAHNELMHNALMALLADQVQSGDIAQNQQVVVDGPVDELAKTLQHTPSSAINKENS